MGRYFLFCLIISMSFFIECFAGNPPAKPAAPVFIYLRDKYPVPETDFSKIDFNYYKLPNYTGNVFPEPQTAVYKDTFIPMKEVKIVLGNGIGKDDLKLALLTRKLEQWGAEISFSDKPVSHGTQIILNLSGYGKPAPDKPEGYSISCSSEGIIAVNSKDSRGLLWGIVSVLQLTKHDASGVAMRSAEINDYPEKSLRCVLTTRWDMAYEVAIFSKLNAVIVQDDNLFQWCIDGWRTPGEILPGPKTNADVLTKLGLDVYWRLAPDASDPKFTASKEEDYQQLLYVINTYFMPYHINLYFAYDDIRFPLPMADYDKFKSARETDCYVLNRLFHDMKKKDPNFKMVFCPPIYFSGCGDRYGESGELYLKAIGEKLDPEIPVFWTGTSVGPQRLSKGDLQWITERIKRKPWYWHNRPGGHAANRSMAADMKEWKTWCYDGMLDDIYSYSPNTIGEQMAVLDASFADCMWNTKNYNAERSACNACEMLLGTGTYSALKQVAWRLRDFDIINGRPSQQVAGSIMLLETKLAETAALLKEAKSKSSDPVIFNKLCSDAWLYDFAYSALQNTKANLKYFIGIPGEAVRPIAEKEAGVLKGDIVFTPNCFMGGFVSGIIPPQNGRFATLIYGAKSGFSELKTGFQFDPYPAARDCKLIISGLKDSSKVDSEIIIKVNDKTLYRGVSGFESNAWTLRTFNIPANMIEKSNRLSISNAAEGAGLGPSWIAVNYAVLKK